MFMFIAHGGGGVFDGAMVGSWKRRVESGRWTFSHFNSLFYLKVTKYYLNVLTLLTINFLIHKFSRHKVRSA
jgi:hypothetical protein